MQNINKHQGLPRCAFPSTTKNIKESWPGSFVASFKHFGPSVASFINMATLAFSKHRPLTSKYHLPL
jgi:hypothetical protein